MMQPIATETLLIRFQEVVGEESVTLSENFGETYIRLGPIYFSAGAKKKKARTKLSGAAKAD